MDILDNAIIIRNYSDPNNIYGAWNRAKALIDTVQFVEELNAINEKHSLGKDFNALNNWFIVMQSSERMWQEDCEDLNLDNLAHWLIYESKDESELRFRLNKVKGLMTGFVWIDKGFSSLHTQVLHITDRLAKIIIEWGSVDEIEARHRSWGIVQYLCKWLEDVKSLQIQMQNIIAAGEQILNPQPAPTKTEPQKNISANNHLLEDDEVKEVFEAFVDKGYMEYTGKYYKWTKSHHLLAYFCEKVSLYFLNSTKTYEGKDSTEWKSFSGLFEVVVKGKVEYPDNERLRVYKNNWYRGKDRKAVEFLPDGYRGVDDILADLH